MYPCLSTSQKSKRCSSPCDNPQKRHHPKFQLRHLSRHKTAFRITAITRTTPFLAKEHPSARSEKKDVKFFPFQELLHKHENAASFAKMFQEKTNTSSTKDHTQVTRTLRSSSSFSSSLPSSCRSTGACRNRMPDFQKPRGVDCKTTSRLIST